MKATGTVRRIDDLGRVVIPKELCRMMAIVEGDPLEFFTTTDKQIVLQKYHLDESEKNGLEVSAELKKKEGVKVTVFYDNEVRHYLTLSKSAYDLFCWLGENDLLSNYISWGEGHNFEETTFLEK